MGKSTTWMLAREQAQPMRLLGAPIPIEGEFRRLGIGIRVNPERGTGPLLQQRMERGGSVLPRGPHLATYHRRSVVAGGLAMAVALHGVELADVSDVDLARLETRTVRAIWGPMRPGRAKEVVYCLLSQGHRTSPVMRTKYDRLTWLARVARVPGATQVLLQAVWECREPPPPLTGPAGRALRTARALGWVPQGWWWKWSVPGQHDPLDMVAEDWGLLRHRARESLTRAALLQLEARCPCTFGGLAGSIDRRA